ncbi:hypothetical protein AB0O34_09750 [Sphaerisporangium sp. NPDC088356]|uniref:hypothetical protein n=1 Tax=Sphaerisporangium sp. NPDC088356 TaxID=3154871 RepID=UPI00343DD698
MTGPGGRAITSALAGAATDQWQAAARRAGVEVRELHEIAEFELVHRLYDEIWHTEPANVPMTVELMRALSHSGNYVAGAFEGAALVGASVGFLAGPPGTALHSHVTGGIMGRGIGFALKLHQRAWALSRGLGQISWTYDPLVRKAWRHVVRDVLGGLIDGGARVTGFTTDGHYILERA